MKLKFHIYSNLWPWRFYLNQRWNYSKRNLLIWDVMTFKLNLWLQKHFLSRGKRHVALTSVSTFRVGVFALTHFWLHWIKRVTEGSIIKFVVTIVAILRYTAYMLDSQLFYTSITVRDSLITYLAHATWCMNMSWWSPQFFTSTYSRTFSPHVLSVIL